MQYDNHEHPVMTQQEIDALKALRLERQARQALERQAQQGAITSLENKVDLVEACTSPISAVKYFGFKLARLVRGSK